MKKTLAFDLDGTIISSSAAENANAKWFSLVGELLGEQLKISGQGTDHFPAVLDAMSKLTGLRKDEAFDKEAMTRYARSLYQLLYLAELRKEGTSAFVPEMVDMLIELKKDCRLALITTAPEDLVLPALEIGKIKSLFDYVYRGPLNKELSKSDVLGRFVKDIGKPALYVGNQLADAQACKELGIRFALAKWGKHDESAGTLANYNLTSPKQLKGVVGLL
ncbi:HAD hydrolase-like protein [Candidatus Woesearchaeota archaeon]|nr:HAD hydrolase-like protein [Candidatus Woesearchaeota archaeon]